MGEKIINEKKKKELVIKINEHSCSLFNQIGFKNVTIFNISAEAKMKDVEVYRLYEKEVNKARVINLILVSIYEETWKEINSIVKTASKGKSQEKILLNIKKQLNKKFKAFPETAKFFVEGAKTSEEVGKTAFLEGLEEFKKLFTKIAPQEQPDINKLLISFKD